MDKNCPNCHVEYNATTQDACPNCGIYFHKWRKMTDPLPTAHYAETLPVKKSKPWGLIALLSLFVAAGIFWRHSVYKEEQAIAAQAARDASESDQGQATPDAPDDETIQANAEQLMRKREAQNIIRTQYEPKLELFLSQMNADASVYGVKFDRRDLDSMLSHGEKLLSPWRLYYIMKEAGISEPRVQRLTQQEKDKLGGRKSTKCFVDGKWMYHTSFPDYNENVWECWRRREGTRDDGYVIWSGVALDTWERYVWQKKLKKWCQFEEHDELRGYRYLINKEYTLQKEIKDRDDSRKRVQEILASDKDKNRIKFALEIAWRTKVYREGAKIKLEKLRKGVQ